MTDTVLFFGSFNPIHNGHTSVAGYVMDEGLCDELWFVVSPQNPLKPVGVLTADSDRLAMAKIAVDETLAGRSVSVSDVEFELPKPSYTIDTITFLRERYPDRSFSILAGADIFSTIDRWKEGGRLFSEYRFLIYPRNGYAADTHGDNVVYMKQAPMFAYSSTDVRDVLLRGDDAGGMVCGGVAEYIKERRLWKSDEQDNIDRLSAAIGQGAATAELYLDRARLYYRTAVYDKALNDFIKVLELDPNNVEAREYASLIREIFAFRYMDYYNP